MTVARALAAACCALLLVGANQDAVVVVEAVGVVSVAADTTDVRGSRDRALQAGLSEAVYQVAAGLLDAPAEGDRRRIKRALGTDPLVYATRFRLLEDRGKRPRLLLENPDVSHEYVVIVQAHVDRSRVRERLAAGGLLAPAQPEGVMRTATVHVEIEGLPSFLAYQSLRDAWVAAGAAESVQPRVFERNRAILEVRARRYGSALARDLARSAPEPWHLIPIHSDNRRLVFRVATTPSGSDGTVRWGEFENPGSIDTREPNRY